MPVFAYTHADGKKKCCTLPDSKLLQDAAYVVGQVIELQRLPGRDEILDDQLQIVPRPRSKPRGLANLMADISALPAAERTKLFAAVAARVLQQDPAFARSIAVAIDGDE
jgi:hypothetical protein